MNHEDPLTSHLRQTLNQGLQDISPITKRRLETARHFALSRQKQEVTALQFAHIGTGRNRLGLDYVHRPIFKHTLAALALLIGMYIPVYWQSHQYISELGEVDSALLSGDLPPEAFLDQDFSAWLDFSQDD